MTTVTVQFDLSNPRHRKMLIHLLNDNDTTDVDVSTTRSQKPYAQVLRNTGPLSESVFYAALNYPNHSFRLQQIAEQLGISVGSVRACWMNLQRSFHQRDAEWPFYKQYNHSPWFYKKDRRASS